MAPFGKSDTDDGLRFDERTTLSVARPHLIRGARHYILLRSFGKILFDKCGIGTASSLASMHAESFQVSWIDIFLSHSWHASPRLKYFTLLLHFNATPAIVSAVCVGVAKFLWTPKWTSIARTRAEDKFVDTAALICFEVEQDNALLVFLLGHVFFWLVLFSWHWLPCISKTVFLDKVCIDQLNPVRKKQGIVSFGAILSRTKEVLVAWDPTYFSRLWCTYELSAFKCANPDRPVKILPIQLGNFFFVGMWAIGLMTVVVLSSEGGYSLLGNTQVSLYVYRLCRARGAAKCNVLVETLISDGLMFVLFFLVGLGFGPHLLSYMYSRVALSKQLESFTVRGTKCFCCDSGHVHPDTEAVLMCDRKLVYNSIAHWYAHDRLNDGLDAFDNLIRGGFRDDVEHKLGAFIPYKHCVALSIPVFLKTAISFSPCEYWSIWFPFHLLLLRMPLYLQLYGCMCRVWVAFSLAARCHVWLATAFLSATAVAAISGVEMLLLNISPLPHFVNSVYAETQLGVEAKHLSVSALVTVTILEAAALIAIRCLPWRCTGCTCRSRSRQKRTCEDGIEITLENVSSESTSSSNHLRET